MKKITVNLPAGEDVPVSIVGDIFLLRSASGDVRVKIPELNIDTPFSRGLSIKLDRQFSRVLLSSETSQIVEIAIGLGDIRDNSVSGSFTFLQSTTIKTLPPATVGTVAAKLINAGNSRKSFRIQNLGGSAIWLGDSTVTTTNGIQLNPGAIMFEEEGANAEIWAVSVVAGQDVRLQYV